MAKAGASKKDRRTGKRRCCYGDCKTDERYPDKIEGISFVAFPKPKTRLKDCKAWIKACGRPLDQLNPNIITRNYYVCSKHFMEGKPTEDCPYPVPYEGKPVRRIARGKRPSQFSNSQTLSKTRNSMATFSTELDNYDYDEVASVSSGMPEDNNFYILYCCTLCDEKFTSADLLAIHRETCTADTGLIKQEPPDEEIDSYCPQQGTGSCSPQEEDSVDLAMTVKFEESDAPLLQDPVVQPLSSSELHPASLKVKLNQIKTETGEQAPLLPKQCEPMTAFPQQTMPIQILSPQIISQQDLTGQSSELKSQYHDAAHNMTASEILRHLFHCSQTSKASGSHPLLPATVKEQCKKKSVSSTSIVRPIRPKESVQDIAEPVMPKIERVYYTSKSTDDPVGQAKLAENVLRSSADGHIGRVLTTENFLKKKVNVPSKSKCIKHKSPPVNQKGASKTTATASITASEQVESTKAKQLESTKAAQSQKQAAGVASGIVGQAAEPIHKSQLIPPASQVVINTPQGIFQVPSTFLQNSQSMLPNSLPILQTAQPVLQNTQTLLQQNMLQQNLLQAQVQQNLQNSLMLNRPAISQVMPVVNQQQFTIKPSLAGTVSSSMVGTTTTAASQKPLSAATTTVASETVASTMNNSTASTLAPVVALSQLVAGITPAPAGQAMQIAVPSPSGPGFLLLTGDIKQAPAGEPQTNSSEVPGTKPLLTPHGGNLPVASLTNQQQGFVQNPSSNVVYLPPVMSQGHILGGIRLHSPNLNLVTVQNIKPVGESTPSVSSAGENSTSKANSSAESATKSSGSKQLQTEVQGVSEAAQLPHTSDNKSSWQDKLESCVPDKTVLDVAEFLLSGDKADDFRKGGPALLNDGRIFVPVAYTGPYMLKNAKSVAHWPWPGKIKNIKKESAEKGDCGRNTEKKIQEDKESESAPAQTITLPGDVVWLFLDRDGPKIVLKMETIPPKVMVLPLDFNLPAEALRQVAEMLSKANIEFPKGLLNAPPVPGMVRASKPKPGSPLPSHKKVVGAMKQKLDRNSRLLLPKVGAPATSTISPTPAPSAIAAAPAHFSSSTTPSHATTPTSVSVKVPPPPLQAHSSEVGPKSPPFPGSVLKKPSPTVVPNIPQVPVLVSALQRQPIAPLRSIEVQHLVSPFAASTLSSVNQTLSGSAPATGQVLKPKVSNKVSVSNPAVAAVEPPKPQQRETLKPKQEEKKQKNIPQLTVNADTKTVKRALDAFVRVEKLTLTQEQEKQAQAYLEARKMKYLAWYGQQLMKKSGLKGKEARPGPSAFIMQNEKNKKNLSDKVKDRKTRKSAYGEKWFKKRRMKRLRTNTSDHGYHLSKYDSGDESESKIRRKSSRSDTSQEDIRRSIRICYKPKPDYFALDNQDYLDEELDQQFDSAEGSTGNPNVSEGIPKHQTKTSANKGRGKSPVPSTRQMRSLGKHSGFDVYIESVEGGDGEGDGGEEQAGNEEDNVELFLKKHKKDTQQVVMREAQGSESSGNILYLCTICGSFQSRSKDDLISHLKQHYSGELSCKTCQFQATSKEELMEHTALEHTGKPLYHCPSCETSFFSKAIYQSHIKRHSTSVVCKVCGRTFLNEGGLKEHMERDHIREFACFMCDQRFISEDKLLSHYTHCRDGFQCCMCVVKMGLLTELKEHMETEHHFKGNLFVCDAVHCGATFITKSTLEHHITNNVHLYSA